MNQHSLGVIGPGSHFKTKLNLVKKNKFFKINGYLRKKKIKKKNFFSEKEFFKTNLILSISQAQVNFMKSILLNL